MTNLFSQIRIRNIDLKNRILMPPLAVKNPEKSGFVNDIVVDYYSKMSGLGMGLVITENVFVSPESKVMPNQLLLSHDKFVEGHKKLVNAIYKNGARVAVEINHAGANLFDIPELKTMLANKDEGDFVVDNEGDVRETLNSINEKDLSKRDITGIVESFGDAAKRAIGAGYDMVEIHAAHGFLINQFLSPFINKRSDEYGGSLTNRMRILIEIIEDVRHKIGETPIIIRFPASDNPPQFTFYPNGLKLEDGLKVAREISVKGVDMIDISGGYSGSRPKELKEIEGYYVPYSSALKEIINIPVNVTGGIRTPEFANYVIKSGKADTVGIGRALLADKKWISKAAEKILEE
ncbi:MAG: NADH:flavin oxidoreductase [Caldisericota bacterium]|nr:NADH:flavin oxidoreductase [Caldisericota bacterium]